MSSHKALIAIVGPSGFGKSTSLRNLPPESTIILDLERKGMPFPNADRFNIKPVDNIAALDREIMAVIANKDIKYCVVESFTKYIEYLFRSMSIAYKGFEVWSNYNKQIGMLLDKVKNDHCIFIFTAIDEIVTIPETDGSNSVVRRIAVKGKEWEGKIEKEMLMVLFCIVKRQTDGKMKYVFQTNTDGITPSKTPMGMFESQLIDNDIAAVCRRAQEYYNSPESTPTTEPTT